MSRWRCASGTFRKSGLSVALEGEPNRVLKLPVSVGNTGYSAKLRIRRTVLNRSRIRQRVRRRSTCGQELRTCDRIQSIEAYAHGPCIGSAARIAILWVVEEIKRIDTELRSNPFGQFEGLRQRRVDRPCWRPLAVADARTADRTQLEAIHCVSSRIEPLEVAL